MSNLVSCRSLGDFCNLLSCWSLRIAGSLRISWATLFLAGPQGISATSFLAGPWGFQQPCFLLVLRVFLHLLSCWSLRIDCWVLEDFSNLLSYQSLRCWSLRITRSLGDCSNADSLLQPIVFGVVVKMLNGTKNKVSAFTRVELWAKDMG